MDSRPYYGKLKYSYGMNECTVDDDDELDPTDPDPTVTDCLTDPDLLLLRKNAKGEREAIAFYTKAAALINEPVSKLFLDTARDEMIHFRKSMILLAKYDPVQARAFADVGINLPLGELRKNHSTNHCLEDILETIDLLSQSIASELEAINMYQESYEQAHHDDVKALFCNNANDEKLHVAEFWKALMMYTKESTVMP